MTPPLPPADPSPGGATTPYGGAAAESPPADAPAGAPAAAEPAPGTRRTGAPALRRWFYPYVGTLAGLTALQAAGLMPARWSFLTVYFVYMSLASTFCPLPTAAPVMYAATRWNPLLVTLLGTLGTGVANLQDYHVLTYLLGRKRIGGLRGRGWYLRAQAWFERAPFLTLAAASFLPVPVDVVRLLAIAAGYPRLRFALASVVGRAPRYAMLAWLADRLQMSVQAILLVLAGTVLLGISRGLPRLVRLLRSR